MNHCAYYLQDKFYCLSTYNTLLYTIIFVWLFQQSFVQFWQQLSIYALPTLLLNTICGPQTGWWDNNLNLTMTFNGTYYIHTKIKGKRIWYTYLLLKYFGFKPCIIFVCIQITDTKYLNFEMNTIHVKELTFICFKETCI